MLAARNNHPVALKQLLDICLSLPDTSPPVMAGSRSTASRGFVDGTLTNEHVETSTAMQAKTQEEEEAEAQGQGGAANTLTCDVVQTVKRARTPSRR